MQWEDYGTKRLSVAKIDEWVPVKTILDQPIVVLDAYVYEEPERGKYAAHKEVRFVFQVPDDPDTVFGTSCGWQVVVGLFERAIADGQFPGRVPSEITKVTKRDGEVYYTIKSPDTLLAEDLPQELPF